MTEIWTWSVWERVPDRETVEASDGHIGDIDEVSFDIGSGCIIVDTGFWIFGKKGMVPAGMIDKIDTESRTVSLSCTGKAVVNRRSARGYGRDRGAVGDATRSPRSSATTTKVFRTTRARRDAEKTRAEARIRETEPVPVARRNHCAWR